LFEEWLTDIFGKYESRMAREDFMDKCAELGEKYFTVQGRRDFIDSQIV